MVEDGIQVVETDLFGPSFTWTANRVKKSISYIVLYEINNN
jgi:hypothetical protein